MPAATPSGISATARPKGLMTPVSAIKMPASTKAATASASVTPWVAAIRAAPGVDQASTTGTFVVIDKSAEPMALAKQTASTQLAVCSGLAPTAVAADSTSAMVEP